MSPRGVASPSRRTVLLGAGVALALPWLESLAPRGALAQAVRPQRFLPVYFPNGGPTHWWTNMPAGTGAAFALSPVLEPFAPIKELVTVLSNVGNVTPFSVDDPSVEPSHPRLTGAFLTCVNADAVRDEQGVSSDVARNGVSADQVLAQSTFGSFTEFDSLQLGLSTVQSSCDARPCALSRSISWRDDSTPLYKLVDPGEVFDVLTGTVAQPGEPSSEVRRALNQSILDTVQVAARRLEPRLGVLDRARLEEFTTSVRGVEQRLSQAVPLPSCSGLERPTLQAYYGLANQDSPNDAPYDKGAHADVMNDLIAMAFQCDLTRVISYMLEDSRSEFTYSHVPLRAFSDTGSAPTEGVCGNYVGALHAGDGNNDYSTITWWQCLKVSELCQKLMALQDGPDTTVLDNCVVMLGSYMHGADHRGSNLPLALIGGGSGRLRTNQHVAFPEFPGDRPLRDLYFTLLNGCFDAGVSSFGRHVGGAENALIEEILA